MGADLTSFEPGARRHVQVLLSHATRHAATMEDAARAVCRVLYEELEAPGPAGPVRACPLVRCFKTHPFDLLEPDLQRAARSRLFDDAVPTSGMRCMTLLASTGDRPEWCSRHTSRRFRAIPINHSALTRMPMWKSVFQQSGLEIPGPPANDTPAGGVAHFVDRSHRSYNVFCVEQAAGSPSVPDQDEFVIPFGIASVFGFGGQLRRGDVYVVLLFSRVAVSREVALRVNAIALDVTSMFFRYELADVFTRAQTPTRPALLPG